jgi:hypothetical protein
MMMNNVFNSSYDTVDYHTCQRLAHHAENVLSCESNRPRGDARKAMSYTAAAYVVSMRNEHEDDAVYLPREELLITAKVVAVLVCARQCGR